ncbi:hypothetical protein R6Q59_028670 [Mikania micrantha]|uniref:DUF4220 domain-containing protein n=1 Tax=Mikania micrantha TaxID=192012 RepID=A0A5N6MA15_9ASTR|nr:hypothetical protein E3N88_32047 [Mikania micrantha]
MGRMIIEIPIPQEWKEVWNAWNLRGVIILSLSLQTFLIFVAPLRKRTKTRLTVMPLWSAYLLADWVANFAVSLISNSQGKPTGETSGKNLRTIVENQGLLAFWAPFLLVHLGGPDTITAFAMEDNELWFRHLLGLFFQCLAAVYVFIQSLPQNRLWIPTMVMFINGILKYAERTRSLYLASADGFKDSLLKEADPGPNYAKFMDAYVSKKEAKLPTRIEMISMHERATKRANKAKRGILTELEVVQYGYQFYEKFRGLVVDMIFSQKERNQSRDFFHNRTASDAFKVVEVELNFIYDVLFTKLPVVYSKIGAISRIFSFVTICSTIVLFFFKNKSNFEDADVTITYGLLYGALVLDSSALLMLLFSDWTIIYLQKSPDDEPNDWSVKSIILTFITRLRKWNLKFKHRRWSQSISTYNLINCCLNPQTEYWESIFNKLGLSWFLDDFFYLKNEDFSEALRDFIFEELNSKSKPVVDLETVEKISSSRGYWVLHIEKGWSGLFKDLEDADYDHSIILWHMVTEICYNHEDNKEKDQSDKQNIAKLLSDYMLHLLIKQQSIMSAVAGIRQLRFQIVRDTCAEAKRFFKEKRRTELCYQKKTVQGGQGIKFNHKAACTELLKVKAEVEQVAIKGGKSKSLLFDSCKLAKKLVDIQIKEANLDKWDVINKLWMELLCYAASHSRASVKAAQISRGGELITIVWLLMTHFGLGNQFEINKDQEILAKLIVGK